MLDEVESRVIPGAEHLDFSSDTGRDADTVELLVTLAEGAYGPAISDADIHRQLPASKEWPDTAKPVFVEPPDNDPPVPPLPSPGPTPDPAPPEALYFYHTDHLGTPIAMTDEDGNIPWRAEYLPFGGVWSLSVSTVPNHLGQYFDGETGLHQNVHRDYRPRDGRYMEPDPAGLNAGPNLCVYAGGDPIGTIDPSGLTLLRCTRPMRGPIRSKDPSGFARHVLLYSTTSRVGCGLGPKTSLGEAGAAMFGMSVAGVIEVESPYDGSGQLRPGYECQVISNDEALEHCAAEACWKPAPKYSLWKEGACFDWIEDVLRSCECQEGQ